MAPYYPYLVAVGSWSDGHAEIHLSNESFIDAEEREHLTWKLEDMKRYRRRCKRHKEPYDEDEAARRISFLHEPEDVEREIARRVKENGDKATINGLHDYIHECYRKELLKEMLRLGWDKRRAKLWIWKDWTLLWGDEEK